MNQILIPSGKRSNYTALDRELFYETEEQNLYIRYNNKWILLCGKGKQDKIEAGTNLEIIEKDNKVYLRLKDDIDIDTMTLGKFSNTIRWKGMVKIGEIENSTVFPLINYSEYSPYLIGGKFLLKIFRENKIEYGIYHATACASGEGSTFGSDSENVKCTLNIITFKDNSKVIGFRTFNKLEKVYTTQTVTTDEYGLSSEVYLILNAATNIQIQSNKGKVAFTLLDWTNTGNISTSNGNRWYEVPMGDFRTVTGIPTYTGTNLDKFDDNSYMYWDIYSTSTQFSIDRVFITKQKSNNEDEAVSEGRIFCHNPSWLTPNDKHTIDCSDGFTLFDNIFTSTSSNNDYTAGVPIEIATVYLAIPSTTTEVTTYTTKYMPPSKIEVWFNGFDSRTEDLIPSFESKEISSSVIIGRD